jgi:hypothetical protein
MNQSSLSKNPACVSNTDYNKLIQLRTIGSNPSNPIPPVTTLEGRLNGENIIFTDPQMYEDYKMRRKVEILQYNHMTHPHGHSKTKNQLYSHMSKVRGASELSQHSIKNLTKKDCPELSVLLPPTNSGVRDLIFPGYQLNRLIPFRRYL